MLPAPHQGSGPAWSQGGLIPPRLDGHPQTGPLLGSRAAGDPWGSPWWHAAQVVHSPGTAQGSETPQLTLRVQCTPGWPGAAWLSGQCSALPLRPIQPHPTAPQGELGRARDFNQGWPQPGHPQAPPQSPGSAEKAAPGTGWGWGMAVLGSELWPKLS